MVAKAMVKCLYCGEAFNRNDPDIKFIKVGRRYAHKTCYDSLGEKEKQKRELLDYCQELFGVDYNQTKINKYLDIFAKEHKEYSYSGIRKSLEYFYRIKGNPVEKANGGLGIVPYVYMEASRYYFEIWKAQQNNAATISNYVNYSTTVVIDTPEPRYKKKPKLWFEGEDE